MAEPELCRSCSKPIIWAVTDRLKDMPVNAEPQDGGNLLFKPRDGLAPLVVMVDAKHAFGRAEAWERLTAEVERLRALTRSVDYFGTGFLWRQPDGHEVVLDPVEVTVVINADQVTVYEQLEATVARVEAALTARGMEHPNVTYIRMDDIRRALNGEASDGTN
jgi:hypothetical protein